MYPPANKECTCEAETWASVSPCLSISRCGTAAGCLWRMVLQLPCSCAHRTISMPPPKRAPPQVLSSHGHPCSRAHRSTSRTSRRPCSAMQAHVNLTHGHPLALAQAVEAAS